MDRSVRDFGSRYLAFAIVWGGMLSEFETVGDTLGASFETPRRRGQGLFVVRHRETGGRNSGEIRSVIGGKNPRSIVLIGIERKVSRVGIAC